MSEVEKEIAKCIAWHHYDRKTAYGFDKKAFNDGYADREYKTFIPAAKGVLDLIESWIDYPVYDTQDAQKSKMEHDISELIACIEEVHETGNISDALHVAKRVKMEQGQGCGIK